MLASTSHVSRMGLNPSLFRPIHVFPSLSMQEYNSSFFKRMVSLLLHPQYIVDNNLWYKNLFTSASIEKIKEAYELFYSKTTTAEIKRMSYALVIGFVKQNHLLHPSSPIQNIYPCNPDEPLNNNQSAVLQHIADRLAEESRSKSHCPRLDFLSQDLETIDLFFEEVKHKLFKNNIPSNMTTWFNSIMNSTKQGEAFIEACRNARTEILKFNGRSNDDREVSCLFLLQHWNNGFTKEWEKLNIIKKRRVVGILIIYRIFKTFEILPQTLKDYSGSQKNKNKKDCSGSQENNNKKEEPEYKHLDELINLITFPRFLVEPDECLVNDRTQANVSIFCRTESNPPLPDRFIFEGVGIAPVIYDHYSFVKTNIGLTIFKSQILIPSSEFEGEVWISADKFQFLQKFYYRRQLQNQTIGVPNDYTILSEEGFVHFSNTHPMNQNPLHHAAFSSNTNYLNMLDIGLVRKYSVVKDTNSETPFVVALKYSTKQFLNDLITKLNFTTHDLLKEMELDTDTVIQYILMNANLFEQDTNEDVDEDIDEEVNEEECDTEIESFHIESDKENNVTELEDSTASLMSTKLLVQGSNEEVDEEVGDEEYNSEIESTHTELDKDNTTTSHELLKKTELKESSTSLMNTKLSEQHSNKNVGEEKFNSKSTPLHMKLYKEYDAVKTHDSLDVDDISKFDEDYDRLGDLLDKMEIKRATKKVIVIGEQGAGKSSLVRRLTKLNLVPVGAGTMTRHPCEIRLYQDSLVPEGKYRVTIEKKPAHWFIKNTSTPTTSGFTFGFATTSALSLYSSEFSIAPKLEDTNKFELECDEKTLNAGCQSMIAQIYEQSTHLKLGRSQFIGIYVTITIRAAKVEPFTIIDVPGYVANIPRNHPFPDDDVATKAIIKNLLKDPSYSNSIVIGAFDASKETNAENLIGLVRELQRSDSTLESRMIGVATKADMHKQALITTKSYLEGDVVGCGLGFYAVVHPTPNTSVQSLKNVYGSEDLNYQDVKSTNIKSDGTFWNFDAADAAESVFWQSNKMDENCGTSLLHSKMKSVFFDKMGDSITKIEQTLDTEVARVKREIVSIPLLPMQLRNQFNHTETEESIFVAFVNVVATAVQQVFEDMKNAKSFSISDLSSVDKLSLSRIKYGETLQTQNKVYKIAPYFDSATIFAKMQKQFVFELLTILSNIKTSIEEIITNWENNIGPLSQNEKSSAVVNGLMKQYKDAVEQASKKLKAQSSDLASQTIQLLESKRREVANLTERHQMLLEAKQLCESCINKYNQMLF